MKFITVAVALGLWCIVGNAAHAQDSRYKAIVTKLLLSEYHAFPILHTNPIFPGWVINVSNESPYLTDCYPGERGGNYKATREVTSGYMLNLDAAAQVGGTVLSKQVAQFEVGGDVKFGNEVAVQVSPVAVDYPEGGAFSLGQWDLKRDECLIIGGIQSGQVPGYFVVDQVIHGRVRFEIGFTIGASVNAKVKSDLLAKIGRALTLNEAEIKVSGDYATMSVSRSPDAMTIGIIPAWLNYEEVARVVTFMKGERGAAIEIAVQEALRARELDFFERRMIEIRNLFGDEISRRNRWAEDMASGPRMTSITDVTDENFRAIGTYAAAMVLVTEAR